MNDSKILNWPGWPVKNNPYGEDFDLAARKRMLAGSQMLFPFIQKYKKDLGNVILEVGPFFNPLITPKDFPNSKIFYWENDHHVIKYLKNSYPNKNVYPIYCDLNKIEGNSFLKLKLETQIFFKEFKLHKISFDSVVISHVFNYIDYKLFLMVLKDFIKKDGLLLINNVIDYGLPAFFSEKRPKSIPDTIKTIKKTGYNILEQKIFESPDKRHQKNNRLIVVARSNEK
ncbi:MAG: hypothetical protein Q8Q06_00675 [bacterium]|nr:hypothetical protein [bacterium]